MNLAFVVFGVISVLILCCGDHGVLGDTDAAWRKAALDRHNFHRANHGAPPLKQNQELCDMSQKYIDELRDTGTPDTAAKLKHSDAATQGTKGENLHYSSWPKGQEIPPEKAVDNWYAEVENYDFDNPGEAKNGKKIGHFTQVVWKGAKEACVSFAKSDEGQNGMTYYYVGANYDTGNVQGTYKENVLRKIEGAEGKSAEGKSAEGKSAEGHSAALSALKDQSSSFSACIFLCIASSWIYAFA